MVEEYESLLKERVKEISGNIENNLGGVILCVRGFSFPGEITGDFAPPRSEEIYHYESGIINEKTKLSENGELSLPDFVCMSDFAKGGWGMYYSYWGNFSINVGRRLKFITHSSDYIPVDVKLLEKIEDGNIRFSKKEMGLDFLNLMKLFDREGYLENFNLLIGDREVEDFLKQRKVRNADDFFETLRNPNYVQQKIDKYYYGLRESLGKDIVIHSKDLFCRFNEIKNLEDKLFQAHFVVERGQNETNRFWSTDAVGIYFGLKREIMGNIEKIEKFLDEGEKLYKSTTLPSIDGKIIGFPATVSFSDYSAYLNHFMKKISKTFNEIDNYLIKEKKENNC